MPLHCPIPRSSDLPGVVTGAILGRLLDRYQPRLVMGFDNLARAALIAAIPTLHALVSLQLWHVFVLALLAGALSPATTAGVRAFVPHLVDDGALDRANALTALIGCRKLGISHPKLNEVLHQDFADCSALTEGLAGQAAAIFCMGTYTGSVSDAELRTITVKYTVEFARVLRLSSPDAAFSFLSGNGADPTGRGRLAFARYKGEAEKALLRAGFPSVYLFRPAYIYPVEPRKEPNLSYRARDLPRVSDAVPEPGDSGRRLGPSDG